MIRLKLMDQPKINKYIKDAIPKIASEYLKAGVFEKEDAMQSAMAMLEQYLPDGIPNPHQFLFQIINEYNQEIGMIWYECQGMEIGFICDFFIKEEFRNQGYGKKTLEIVEKHAKERGIKKLSLHVFGHNDDAISLYKKGGYQPVSIYMAKDL